MGTNMRAAPVMVSIASCFMLIIVLALQLRFTRGAYKPPLMSIESPSKFSGTGGAGGDTAADLQLRGPIRNVTESAPSYEVTIYRGRLGQYLTRLYIGTPAVSFTAIVDTGSDLVWRQCKPCVRCYPQADGGASIFDAARSATYETATCQEPLCKALHGRCSGTHSSHTTNCSYAYFYTAGYTAGELSYDVLSMRRSGELQAAKLAPRVRLAFGCSHNSRAALNFTGAGGILGLGGGRLSLPSQLGVGAFSYCLPTRRLSGAPLVLGPTVAALGVVPARVRARMQSARMIRAPQYGENLRFVSLGVSVGGRRLWGEARAAILDTGSPFMSLSGRAYDTLLQAFRSRIPLTPGPPLSLGTDIRLELCYQKRQLLTLINGNASLVPSLTLHLGRARLRLPTRNYVVAMKGLLCLAVRQLDSHIPIIIGNIQQQNYFFLYDLKSRSISVAATDCSNYTSL